MNCVLYPLFALTVLHLVSAALVHDNNGHIDDSPQARLIFNLADKDNNTELTYQEFQQVFHDIDMDGDGNVTSTEFVDLWVIDNIGEVSQGVRLFLNLDVNKDVIINQIDMPYIFIFFDRNANNGVSEGEFVIQWVKISL